jgi:iron complex outermembrane receptor protein
MRRYFLKSSLFASAGIGCLLCAPMAFAQPAAGQAASGVDEVVVTATKRVENVQNVPISVVVVSQAAITSQGFSDTSDLKRVVPGLVFNAGGLPGNNTIQIRGVSTNATGQGLEQSVGFAFDGVSLARPAGGLADLVDIAGVEVLKGPQGMLFGKNADAGEVNIVSNTPMLGVAQEIGHLSYGTLNYIQATGTANVPIGDTAAARISLWRFKHDGFIHETNTGQDLNDKNTLGGRLRLRWKPAPNLDLNFTAELSSHHQNGVAGTIDFFKPSQFSAGNNGALIQAWELAHGIQPAYATNSTAHGIGTFPYFDHGHAAAYTGQADWSIGEGTLTAIASYRKVYGDTQYDPYPSDNPYNQQPRNEDVDDYNQRSVELRYASPKADRLNYVVGAFYMNLKEKETFSLQTFPPFINDYFLANINNYNYAAFGEANFDITKQLTLIGGLRYSRDEVNESMNRGFLSPAPAVIQGLTTPGATFGLFQASAAPRYTDLSWRAGLQYKPSPDMMYYLTASRGYKGPGVAFTATSTTASLASTSGGIVNPEIAHNFEAGLRTQWFDRRLTLNASVFDETFDNFQTSAGSFVNGVLIFAVSNAPQLKSDGVDVSASWAVTPQFKLSGDITYDKVRFTNYPSAPCWSNAFQTAAQGCVGGFQSLTGHPLGNTTPWAGDVTARYEAPISDKFTGWIQGNSTYRGPVVFSTTGDPSTAQRAITLVNFNLGVRTSDGRFSLSVYGNNVFGVHYVDTIGQFSGALAYIQTRGYGDLRTFGVALDARF